MTKYQCPDIGSTLYFFVGMPEAGSKVHTVSTLQRIARCSLASRRVRHWLHVEACQLTSGPS